MACGCQGYRSFRLLWVSQSVHTGRNQYIKEAVFSKKYLCLLDFISYTVVVVGLKALSEM